MRMLFLLALLLLLPVPVDAASLYLSPASLSLAPGQTGTFGLYVESSAQAMNAVSGTVSVSGMSVGGVSKAGSVISFWAAEPSATGNTVSFEGVVLSPGYTGGSGKILSFTVRAATAGTYSASFLSGSVLANDGKGTNITSGTRGGAITVVASKEVPTPKPTPKPAPEEVKDSGDTPAAPTVHSREFPSAEKWYAKSSGTFSWEVPSNVTAVRTLLDQNKSSVPSILLDGRTVSRVVNDIPEGINYFHVQFKNAAGWGAIAHVRVAVDITPPSLTVLNAVTRSDSTDPRIAIDPTASDDISGLDRFEMSIDGTSFATLADAGGRYLTAPFPPGTYQLSIRAVDKAGNVSAVRTHQATVDPISGPTILSLTKDPVERTTITVTGTASVPGTTAKALFMYRGKVIDRAEGVVAADGTFSTTLSGGLPQGTYKVQVYIEDERGAQSLVVEGGKLSVKGQPLDAMILHVAQILGAFAVFAAVVGGAVWLLLALGVRIARKHTEFIGELREADTITRKAFALLKEDVAGYADYLKRRKRTRPLSDEEIQFIEALEEDLAGSEQIIRKEIADAAASAPRSRKNASVRKEK